jgi:hypothetical protein
MPTTPSRRRGGQPGNTNAYKHGFYTAAFISKEYPQVSSGEFYSLNNEINLLRAIIQCTFENVSLAGFTDLTMALRVLCLSLSCLNRLIRTDTILKGAQEQPTLPPELSAALSNFLHTPLAAAEPSPASLPEEIRS